MTSDQLCDKISNKFLADNLLQGLVPGAHLNKHTVTNVRNVVAH